MENKRQLSYDNTTSWQRSEGEYLTCGLVSVPDSFCMYYWFVCEVTHVLVIFCQKWHVNVGQILKVTNLLLSECSKK